MNGFATILLPNYGISGATRLYDAVIWDQKTPIDKDFLGRYVTRTDGSKRITKPGMRCADVILTDGKAGTVESVWLDEIQGLRISIRGHERKWPVSTIKFAQTT